MGNHGFFNHHVKTSELKPIAKSKFQIHYLKIPVRRGNSGNKQTTNDKAEKVMTSREGDVWLMTVHEV